VGGIAILAFSALLGELSLRIFLGLGTPVLIAPDTDQASGGFGYAPAPNQSVRRFLASNEINRFSMRSRDVSETKPSGRLRIYFIGDSVTYGTTYVDQSSIFTSVLSRELPQRLHQDVEILNASAGGWAASNEVAFLKKRGTFNADVVLIVLNTADLTQPFANFEASINSPTERPSTAFSELWSRYIAPRVLG